MGLEPSEELKRLEQAILRQDPGLELAGDGEEAQRPREGRPSDGAVPLGPVPERALLVVPRALSGLDALLRLAEPLAGSRPARELIVAGVVPAAELHGATTVLAARRDELLAAGRVAGTAAFSSPNRGQDVARLAAQENVDLLLVDAGRSPLEGEHGVVLERAPCDVALLVDAGGSLRDGPVLVPFGAAGHDWAALELGAWVARAVGAPLWLIGAADRRERGRDASRLLADASLIVQRTAGILAEPQLAKPGRRGITALAEGAGLLVVGLSDRWRTEGLGRARSELAAAPPAPTVFVRRGTRPRAGGDPHPLHVVADRGEDVIAADPAGDHLARCLRHLPRSTPRCNRRVRELSLLRLHEAAAEQEATMLRRNTILTTAALMAVLAAPAAAQTYDDLRSPDAKDAAAQRGLYESDSGRSVPERSYGSPGPYPDSERELVESPEVQGSIRQIRREIRETPAVIEVHAPSAGFDWGDAGIGAAGMLALFSIAAGSALMLGGRRRRRGVGVATH